MLAQAGNQEKHGEAVGGLAAGPFELVLKVGVFIGGQVERGSVSHESERDVVGEEVCEE